MSEPVFLPEERALNGRISVTGARQFNACPRAGYLYALTKGEDASHAMERGSALHHAIEQCTREVLRLGEVQVPPEVAKAIVNDVLADPRFAVPIEEHDYLRESVYRWAEFATFDPSAILGIEQMFELDLGGWTLRARLDYVTALEQGAVVSVEDYKSSRAMVGQEEIGRVRPDGSIAAKAFQLVAYALCVAFGYPVRVEPCGVCSGKGYTVEVGPANASARLPCPACGGFDPLMVPVRDRVAGAVERMGTGVIETREPFRVADRAQRFDVAYVYPGIRFDDGPGRRAASLTRLELVEYRASMEGILGRLGHAVESGEWPAIPSDHCENECPARSLCPRLEQRSLAGRVNTPEEARAEAERLWVQKLQTEAGWKELKAFVKVLPGQRLRFGADRVIEPVPAEFDEVVDREGMFDAIDRTARFGEKFERERFVRHRSRSPVTVRKLKEEELAAEAGDIIDSEGS